MFEMVPKEPHKTKCNLMAVADSMRHRYSVIQQRKEVFLTIPSVPFLGTTYTKELKAEGKFDNTITQSKFIDDNHITIHPRFPTLTRTIR